MAFDYSVRKSVIDIIIIIRANVNDTFCDNNETTSNFHLPRGKKINALFISVRYTFNKSKPKGKNIVLKTNSYRIRARSLLLFLFIFSPNRWCAYKHTRTHVKSNMPPTTRQHAIQIISCICFDSTPTGLFTK